MQLTHETRRTWWSVMLATWLLCAGLVLLHMSAVRDYVSLLNAAGAERVQENATPLRQVIPARYADAQMWVRHVLAADEAGAARVRFTHVDNAPHGREVHWSSAFAWLVRAAGALQRTLTADGWPLALERSLLWFNAPLLLGLVLAFSGWTARLAGAGAGMLVALGMIGHKRFYEGFLPAYVDHHGLATAAVFGLVLGAAFMGAGWWKPAAADASLRLLPISRERARNGAAISALCGAAGMWISAAAVLPAIALTGAAGLAVTWWQGASARRDGATFDPGVWRLWGRVGAAASFVCYLIEYAPGHLGLRLEVNHPLYSFAWWGGAEFIAVLASWRLSGAKTFQGLGRRLVFPGLAMAAVPAVILLAGSRAFLIGDPFVGDLRHFVAEGRSLPATVRQFGAGAVGFDLASAVVLIVVALFLLGRRDSSSRIVIGMLLGVTAGFVIMGLAEMRWWMTASGPQIALLLVLLAAAGRGRTPARRWALAGLGALVFLFPAVQRIVRERTENQQRVFAAGDLLQPLYRDIAAVLRDSQPADDIVLLAGPNASAGISYFGRFKTLGMLYWENAFGLRAAAEIFSAEREDEALRLIRARGVTHIAMLSTANFLGEYFQLLHPNLDPAEATKSFGYRLLAKHSAPRWLQPVPYRPPAELKEAVPSVLLFKIAVDQSEVEHLYYIALAQVASGDVDLAEKTIARALERASAGDRLAICEAAGAAFYDYGADAAAARIFRHGLGLGHAPMIANTLAWILATSSDATVRDGRAALELVETRAREEPDDPTLLSTLAAAYAEVGRFPDAVRAAERAVVLVRAAGDPGAERLLQQRLESYRAGRPWRQ